VQLLTHAPRRIETHRFDGRHYRPWCTRRPCSRAGVIVILAALLLPAAAFGQPGGGELPPDVRVQLGAGLPGSAEPDVRLRTVAGNRPDLPPALPEVPFGFESVAPAGAEQVRFELGYIDLDGVTAYPLAALQRGIEGRYGRTVTLAQVYDIAAELQRRYREDGWFLARVLVPPQRIEGGRLRFEVLEGHISDIELQGDIGPSARLVRAYLDKVTAERPLRLATLERALLLAKDIPGIDVKGILQPADDVVGAARLIVVASRRPFTGLALVDNIGSSFTGEWELAARVAANAHTALGEEIGFTGLISDPANNAFADQNNQKVGMINGSVRVGDLGSYVSGLVSYGDSNPGGIIEEFAYQSKKLLVSFRLVHPIIRARARNLFADIGFDYIDSDTDVFEDVPFVEDRLRVLTASLAFDFRDRFRGSSYLGLGLRHGLDAFDATPAEDPFASRFDADGSFTTMQFTASRLQAITDRWGLYLLTSAQYAFDRVLSDEEFDVGGIDFGRGYNPKELSGDDGIGLTAELQYTKPSQRDWLERWQAFAFYDFGYVRQQANDLLPSASASLASAGAGVRTWFAHDLSLELQVAQPLTRNSQRADDTRDTQLLVRAIARF
jgi:hemolysin activation/secretion protein